MSESAKARAAGIDHGAPEVGGIDAARRDPARHAKAPDS